MRKYLNSGYNAVMLFILASCAIQVGPQGGPKDTNPPKVVKENPVNKTVNFDKEKIVLTFNEYPKVNNPSQEVIISPLMNPAPKFLTKKKEVIIKFEDSLKKNTTYTIQFGKAISDITENNVMDDYMYIFSTGPKLDSLQIKGRVIDVLTNTYKENIKVMLHKPGKDSCIYKIKPDYYAKTLKEGDYIFNNLHTNTYKIYALNDENGNYLFDKGEQIAFLNIPIELHKNITLSDLVLFKEKEEKLHVIDKGSKEIKKYYLAFNAPVDSIRVNKIVDGKSELIENFLKINEARDSAFFWLDKETDSLKLIVDLLGENKSTDTLLINIIQGKKDVRQKPPAKMSLKPKINLYTTGKCYMDFNMPIKHFDRSKLSFYIDSNKTNIKPEIYFTDSSYTSLQFSFDYSPAKNYRMIFARGTFMGPDSIMNDSIAIPIRTAKESELGIIGLDVSIERKGFPVLVQLLDDKYKVLKEISISKNTKINYKNLLPGKYHIRCVLDKNRNSKWDTGNLLKGRQPEEIIYFKEEINLKANWELNDLKIKI